MQSQAFKPGVRAAGDCRGHLRTLASAAGRRRKEVAGEAADRKCGGLSALSAGPVLLEQVDAGGFQESSGLLHTGCAERFTLCLVLRGAGRYLQFAGRRRIPAAFGSLRSEEHTSELQSHLNIVSRLLL